MIIYNNCLIDDGRIVHLQGVKNCLVGEIIHIFFCINQSSQILQQNEINLNFKKLILTLQAPAGIKTVGLKFNQFMLCGFTVA